MNKNILRFISIILSFVILSISGNLQTLAVIDPIQTVSYAVEEVTGDKGETVCVPIKFYSNTSEPVLINGIIFSLSYETSKLEYISASTETSFSINGLTAFDKDGKVSFAWFDVDRSELYSGTTLCVICFRIKDEAPSGSSPLVLKHDKIYRSRTSYGTSDYIDYECTTPTVTSKINITLNSTVQTVIDAINAIGTVSNSEDCYNQIAEASRLYGKLTLAQKEKVTNYDVLVDAEETYNKLVTDEAWAKVYAEITKFRTDHAEALAVTIVPGEEELNIDKLKILQAAFNKFGKGSGKLSAAAQAELLPEYRRLGLYIDLIKAAQQDLNEREKLEQLKQWDIAASRVYIDGGYEIDPLTGNFITDSNGGRYLIIGLTESKSEWADILTKTKNNVTADDYARLNYFKTTWYDPVVSSHPTVEYLLDAEYNGLANQLMSAFERAKTLYDESNTTLTLEEETANNFKCNFLPVLSLTTDTVEYEDLSQIKVALSVYEVLPLSVQELLIYEHTHLKALETAASANAPSESEHQYNHVYDNSCDSTCNVCGYERTVTHTYSSYYLNNETKHWRFCLVCGIIAGNAVHRYDNTCDATCNICNYVRKIQHSYDSAWITDSNYHWKECSVCQNIENIESHIFDNACDTTCNTCQYTRTIAHVYDNSCDTTCNICGNTRETTHTYSDVYTIDGTSHWNVCMVCGSKTASENHIFDNQCDTTCNICKYNREAEHKYHSYWMTNETLHWAECSLCNNVKNISVHNFENACDSTCDICGYERPITHNFEFVWSHDGNYHWQECSVCGIICNNEYHIFTNSCDTTCNICGFVRTITHTYDDSSDNICNICGYVRSVGHNYKSTWSNDSENHWYECSDCKDKIAVSTHIYANDCDTTCIVCGYKRPASHSYKTEYSFNGTEHWKECSHCKDKIDAENHVYDNSCDDTCNICGLVRTVTHNYKTILSNDSENHWYECSVCKNKVIVSPHIYDNSCDTTCNICGYVRSVGHNYVDVVTKPTCTEQGYTTHKCSVCQYEYVDTYVEPSHKPGEWVIIKEASYGEDGYEELYCTVCEKLLDTRVISVNSGFFVSPSGNTYYYENGVKVTGWKTINGKDYYFSKSTGAMLKNTLATLGGVLYAFDINGVKIEDAQYEIINDKCYYGGFNVTGWQIVDGNKYYFSTADGLMKKDFLGIIGDTLCKFDENGKYVQEPSGYVLRSDKCYDKDGNSVVGWVEIYGDKYYFGKSDGIIRSDFIGIIGNALCKFDENGRFVEDENYVVKGGKCYDKNGVQIKGWVVIYDKDFYFSKSTGTIMMNTSALIGGKIYKFAPNGVCLNK